MMLLPSVRSEAENTVVYNLMNSAGDGTKNVWLGMNRCGDCESDRVLALHKNGSSKITQLFGDLWSRKQFCD